ncbi:aromatic amino acid transaminase [Jannaschia sp. LMIT008]|uniref:amino acid aminotransferase n=1 Tax=Jannaschia maritima TaxID=3032585 RepID=UPI0035ABB499
MLDGLPQAKPDGILALMAAFRDDPRSDKIDLGVGVYRDARGRTPVMRAVKAAERVLLETQDTKTYTGLPGDPAFARALAGLVMGADADLDGLAMAAAPGGTGAVHQALQLVRMGNAGATVWLPDPTWPNHPAIAGHVGLERRSYRYLDPAAQAVDLEGMLRDLGRTKAGDVVVLHGCCHNPTGADPRPGDWARIADALAATGAVPLIDLAYLGLGDGLDRDAAGLRTVLDAVPEGMVAVSCSKNFGLYRERAGLLIVRGGDRARVQGAVEALNRLTYSFPPDHGARVVQTVLDDPALRAEWEGELAEMRGGIAVLRQRLRDDMRDLTGSDRFGFVAAQKGMFSRLDASPEQVAALRDEHGVYVVGDGRMNLAGLDAGTVPILARALVAVGL